MLLGGDVAARQRRFKNWLGPRSHKSRTLAPAARPLPHTSDRRQVGGRRRAAGGVARSAYPFVSEFEAGNDRAIALGECVAGGARRGRGGARGSGVADGFYGERRGAAMGEGLLPRRQGGHPGRQDAAVL